jgi:hypothetical protein
MDRFDDDIFAAELRALRPAPRPAFAAELDERAAAGFPRRQAPSATAWPFVALADLWRGLSPRRRLVPVLAVALAALVVATGVVAISQSGGGSSSAEDASLGMVESSESGGAAAGEEAYPAAAGAKLGTHRPHHSPNNVAGTGTGGAKSSGETVYAPEVPSVTSEPATGAPVEESAEESAGAEESGEAVLPTIVPPPPTKSHRDVERSAYIVLGTKPGEVSAASAKVFEAVHAAKGYVLHSKVDSGSSGATGAYFELMIPSDKVEDALASISRIAEVRARHDETEDITAPTVSAAEELRDSNATIEGLLKELGEAETEAEREAVEARLREERGRHAAIRARLDHLGKRAAMSEVQVQIVTGHGAGVVPPPSKGTGSWGVGDALHDAGDILTIAAGVLLIGLAVLAPIALIAFAFWLANRFRVRRLRERTLG